MANRPAPPLALREGDRAVLESWTRSSTLPASAAKRARIVLLAADGVANARIAKLTDTAPDTVLAWRARYEERGLRGLSDLPRSGRPRELDHRAIVTATLKPPPKKLGVTHWSSRLLADRLGVGYATIARAWRAYGIKPWKAESFRFSTDPELVGKVTDICGLCLGVHESVPESAIVLCADEKSQIQALDRTVPILPMTEGRIERRSHDYYRRGTSTLFAALDIATGQVTAALKPRHRHQEFLAFLKQIERAYRDVAGEHGQAVELRLVMDKLRRAQARERPRLAGEELAVRCPLHPGPRLLDEHGDLVRYRRTTGHPPRRLQVGQGPQHQNPRIHRWLERTKPPLRLDQDHRPDPRESQPLNNFESTPLDEILGNATDIPITEHATDTHGVTLVNFGLFDLLPRCWSVSSRRPVARTRWPRRSRSTGRCGERSTLPATCPTRRIGARSPGSSTRATRCTL